MDRHRNGTGSASRVALLSGAAAAALFALLLLVPPRGGDAGQGRGTSAPVPQPSQAADVPTAVAPAGGVDGGDGRTGVGGGAVEPTDEAPSTLLVSGRCVARGAPLAGVAVGVDGSSSVGESVRTSEDVRTARDGAFALTIRRVRGAGLVVRVAHPDFVDRGFVVGTVPRAGDLDVGDLVLERATAVVGRVFEEASGVGVEGAVVRMRRTFVGRHDVGVRPDDLITDAMQRTDPSGGYAFAELPAGAWKVSASLDGYLPSTGRVDTSAGGEHRLDLPLRRASSLAGLVLFDGEGDRTGLQVLAKRVGGADVVSSRGVVGVDGRFELALTDPDLSGEEVEVHLVRRPTATPLTGRAGPPEARGLERSFEAAPVLAGWGDRDVTLVATLEPVFGVLVRAEGSTAPLSSFSYRLNADRAFGGALGRAIASDASGLVRIPRRGARWLFVLPDPPLAACGPFALPASGDGIIEVEAPRARAVRVVVSAAGATRPGPLTVDLVGTTDGQGYDTTGMLRFATRGNLFASGAGGWLWWRGQAAIDEPFGLQLPAVDGLRLWVTATGPSGTRAVVEVPPAAETIELVLDEGLACGLELRGTWPMGMTLRMYREGPEGRRYAAAAPIHAAMSERAVSVGGLDAGTWFVEALYEGRRFRVASVDLGEPGPPSRVLDAGTLFSGPRSVALSVPDGSAPPRALRLAVREADRWNSVGEFEVVDAVVELPLLPRGRYRLEAVPDGATIELAGEAWAGPVWYLEG